MQRAEEVTKRLKNNKSPASDNLKAEQIKHGPIELSAEMADYSIPQKYLQYAWYKEMEVEFCSIYQPAKPHINIKEARQNKSSLLNYLRKNGDTRRLQNLHITDALRMVVDPNELHHIKLHTEQVELCVWEMATPWEQLSKQTSGFTKEISTVQSSWYCTWQKSLNFELHLQYHNLHLPTHLEVPTREVLKSIIIPSLKRNYMKLIKKHSQFPHSMQTTGICIYRK